MKKLQTIFSKLFSGSGWALFTMFVWEMVEELLENLIAFALSSAVAIFVTKALSTLVIITATQGIKVSVKRFLFPFFKKLIYREGNDKVSKIKQFFQWIYANKKTLIGTIAGAVTTLSGTGVINISGLPALNIGSFNLTPVIYYGALLALTLLGVFGKGVESIAEFFERIGLIKAEKEQNAIIKQAQKEIKAEEKIANRTQTETDKEQARKDAEEKAKAEKAKADAEYRTKVEQAKAKLKAEAEKK